MEGFFSILTKDFLKILSNTILSSNLKTKAEQARARTDNINSDAMETRRELNEDIIPGIERAMADVERVTQINKVAKQNDEQIGKSNN